MERVAESRGATRIDRGHVPEQGGAASTMRVLPRRELAIRGAAGVATLAIALVGCTAGSQPVEPRDDPPPRELPSLPGSAPLDPEEAAAAEEILAVLSNFRNVEADIYADPPPPDIVRRDISPYLADPMQGEIVGTLYDMYTAGIVFVGRPVSEPTVVEVRLDDTPPTATVRDCVDVASWQSVFQETGDPVPGDSLPDRYVMRLEAKLYPEHGWLFENFAIEEGTQC